MRIPNLYDALNFMDSLAARAKSAVMRCPYDAAESNTRAGVYARAQKRFDFLVQGGDLINFAPVRPLDPLVNVAPADHADLMALGAIVRDDEFLMPADLDDEERWKFQKWFPRAPKDLAAQGTNWELTADGHPTIGYILPEDLFRGGDSTATVLLMGMFPVLFALGYALAQIPVFGLPIALLVCAPLLALHAYALYQTEGAGTLVKVLALSGGLPMLMAAFNFPTLSPSQLMLAAVVVGLAAIVAAGLRKTGNRTPMFSLFTRISHVILVVSAVFALNLVLGKLPEWMAWAKPMGMFVVACAYPLYFTLGNFKARTAELEMLSKQRAGSTQGEGGMLGKTAPIRMEQIRASHRDNSPFMPFGTALGVLAKYDLAIAPDAGQPMGLTVEDAKTHIMVFGYTGKGKTAKFLRPYMLELAKLPMAIGAIVSDGKGALVADTRDWYDIIVEPGTKFGPFQGMSSLMVANAFAEANGESFDNKDSVWVQGAGTLHRFALSIHEALVEHEKSRRELADKRLAYIEQQVEYLAAEKVILQRKQQDTYAVDAALGALVGMMRTILQETKKVRTFFWTPGAYMDIQNILCTVVMTKGGLYRPCNKALELLRYLGHVPVKEGEDPSVRDQVDPGSRHPHLADPSRVLSQAVDYFETYFTNGLSPEQRNSFQLNAAGDVQGFLQNDELRGGMIDGVDVGETAWSHTEEGVDILQCLYGKKVGINISESEGGKTAKVILKLIDMRVYDAVQRRNKQFGDLWPEKTGQTQVVKIVDEAQDLISGVDAKIVAKARSMGLTMVYATQTYEGLGKALGGDDAKVAFVSNFRSEVVFESSQETYEFIQRKAGTVEKMKVPVTVQAKLDSVRAIASVHNTIYADENHPSAHILRDQERRGATRMQPVIRGMAGFAGMTRKVAIDEMPEQNYMPVFLGGEYVEGPVLEMKDMTTHLLEGGNALFYLNRADHPRVDFARVEYISTKAFAKRLAEIKRDKALEDAKALTSHA